MCIGFNRMRLAFLIVFISLFLSGCFPGYADLEKKRLLKIRNNTNTNSNNTKYINNISNSSNINTTTNTTTKYINNSNSTTNSISSNASNTTKYVYTDSVKSNKTNFDNAKKECEEIGFKKGTEKFGECVLDLTE